ETFVFRQCPGYAVLTGVGLRQSKGIWGRFAGWHRTARTNYPSIRATKQAVSEDFQRYSPKLKRFKAFGDIIKSPS
ncbi:MAG: hypothetical protein LBD58_10215, partial [Treponema sp.]|nr:hypothetical protein [Treponema sp.]